MTSQASLRHRVGAIARATLNRIENSTPVELAAPPPGSDRAYFLALSEYHRRREDPLPHQELAPHELRVSSQNGEDGVIQEILRRLGTSDRPFFVEFGIQNGSQGNAVLLADSLGWEGLFMETDPTDYAALERKYRHGPVRTRHAFVTRDDIEQLLADEDVPQELDLMSIDIDGDDYWVWNAITSYRPRLVVIEYNAQLPADRRLVQPYGAESLGSNFFGASLGALIALGAEKGYRLVHTDTCGVNAFFVREDLHADWSPPRAAGANHFLSALGHPDDTLGRGYIDLQRSTG